MAHPFDISRLDHVAINVKDMTASIAWYEKVLGLKRVRVPEWGAYPIFMLAGETGIAIFPADLGDTECPKDSNNVKIDHFAFTVSNEAYRAAIDHYSALGISFTEKDHHHFLSVYTKDPDGHTVELTTLKASSTDFYQP